MSLIQSSAERVRMGHKSVKELVRSRIPPPQREVGRWEPQRRVGDEAVWSHKRELDRSRSPSVPTRRMGYRYPWNTYSIGERVPVMSPMAAAQGAAGSVSEYLKPRNASRVRTPLLAGRPNANIVYL